MKRILLCDVDGVLADFVGGVCKLLPPGTLTPSMVTCWDFIDPAPKGLLSEHHHRLVTAACSYGSFWESLPYYDGAGNALEAIRQSDIEVVALTSPWDSCSTWSGARTAWLKALGFTRHQVIITPRKELVRGNYFLDDKPEHVAAWMHRNTAVGRFRDERQDNARLVTAPYNLHTECLFQEESLPRVDGWVDVLRWLKVPA